MITLSQNICVSIIDSRAIEDCNTLFDLAHTQQYKYAETEGDNRGEIISSDEVHQDVIDFYSKFPPLHKTCLDIHVQAIHDCIDTCGADKAFMRDHDGITLLHSLVMTPHADAGVIGACFRVNLNAELIIDNRGNPPLDYEEYNTKSNDIRL